MIDKANMIKSLNDSVDQFNEMIANLNKDQFEINMNGKWSAGQDLVHLIKVLRIVNIGLSLPKPILRVLYGVNKKEARTFQQLQTVYKKALEGGAKAPSIYIPKPALFIEKSNLIKKHQSLNESLVNKINNLTEIELDTFSLPHPILGKVTLGELSIFTSFHTVHHVELLKSKLNYSLN
jgi:hypothetical protein